MPPLKVAAPVNVDVPATVKLLASTFSAAITLCGRTNSIDSTNAVLTGLKMPAFLSAELAALLVVELDLPLAVASSETATNTPKEAFHTTLYTLFIQKKLLREVVLSQQYTNI